MKTNNPKYKGNILYHNPLGVISSEVTGITTNSASPSSNNEGKYSSPINWADFMSRTPSPSLLDDKGTRQGTTPPPSPFSDDKGTASPYEGKGIYFYNSYDNKGKGKAIDFLGSSANKSKDTSSYSSINSGDFMSRTPSPSMFEDKNTSSKDGKSSYVGSSTESRINEGKCKAYNSPSPSDGDKYRAKR